MRYMGLDLIVHYHRDSVPVNQELVRKQGERDVYGEFGTDIVYWRDSDCKFRADKPVSFSDVEGGGFCARSGFWFPARRIVVDGGVKYGDKFYRPAHRPHGEDK